MSYTAKTNKFAKILLNWFVKNKRDFPWRNEKDPYKILIAEKMLQKTKANNVVKVYVDFLHRYPTPTHLAKANIKSIKKCIKPLGLQNQRSRELKKIATTLVKKYKGKIPNDEKSLSSIIGIGKYTRNAILCFAFDENRPIVDVNVLRILQRVFGIRSAGDIRNDEHMWKFAANLLPLGKSKEFNWALLDFASQVCTSKRPKCSTCPMNFICKYSKKLK